MDESMLMARREYETMRAFLTPAIATRRDEFAASLLFYEQGDTTQHAEIVRLRGELNVLHTQLGELTSTRATSVAIEQSRAAR